MSAINNVRNDIEHLEDRINHLNNRLNFYKAKALKLFKKEEKQSDEFLFYFGIFKDIKEMIFKEGDKLGILQDILYDLEERSNEE